jgi:hypothetical protein
MASLHEYFVRDARTLTTHQSWAINRKDGSVIGEIIARLHFDFNANAKYISFYIPALDEVTCPEALALAKLPEILQWPETQVDVTLRSGSEQIEGRSLVFTGRVYLYSERPISDELRQPLLAQAKAQGHSLIFRSVQYVTERNRWEKPRAFISHDSRDKTAIAEPLAAELQNLRCPVWFDKFSLKVGDSLRQSITATSQRGLSPRPAQVSPDGPRYFGGTFLPFNALLRCPPRAVLSPPSKAIRSNCFCNSTRWSRSL